MPYVLFSINEDLPSSAPDEYSIKPEHSQMLAYRGSISSACTAASGGSFHLTKFNPGKGASGNYELYFKDGGVEMGEFGAKWNSVKNLMCS